MQVRQARRKKAETKLQSCVKWCLENGKGARAAISEGLCDVSHEATLNRRLHDATTGADARPAELVSHADQRVVLLPHEEDELVVFCCIRGQQGVSVTNEELSDAVMTMLRLRHHHNTTAEEGGKKLFPLTTAAQEALDRGAVSTHWHTGFKSRHSDALRYA